MSEQSNGVRYKNSGNCSLPVWFLTFPFTFRILNSIISEMLNVHKIFRGRKEMSEEDMRSGTVVGGAVALAEKLRADHAWDGRTLIAAPIAVLEMGAIVDNYWSVLGELKDVSFGASTLWARGDKELRVAIKLEDLKVFHFKGGERERNGGNLSEWLSREDLGAGEVTFTKVDGTEVNFEEAAELHGVSEFSIICCVPRLWQVIIGCLTDHHPHHRPFYSHHNFDHLHHCHQRYDDHQPDDDH